MASKLILHADFQFNEKVAIDDGDIRGRVTGITFRPGASNEMMADSYVQYEVSWWAGGLHYTNWFDGFRLEHCPN
jgi:hypothetical protein